MSKLEDLDLPEIPEGHRWRVVIDLAIKKPKLLLERKVWWGWKRVDSRYISYEVWRNMDTAIIFSANELVKNVEAKLIARKYID